MASTRARPGSPCRRPEQRHARGSARPRTFPGSSCPRTRASTGFSRIVMPAKAGSHGLFQDRQPANAGVHGLFQDRHARGGGQPRTFPGSSAREGGQPRTFPGSSCPRTRASTDFSRIVMPAKAGIHGLYSGCFGAGESGSRTTSMDLRLRGDDGYKRMVQGQTGSPCRRPEAGGRAVADQAPLAGAGVVAGGVVGAVAGVAATGAVHSVASAVPPSIFPRTSGIGGPP